MEIGGGTGVLTRALARRAAHVVTIEVDERLAARLRRSSADDPTIEVVTGDALDVQLPTEPFRVVANLPFNGSAKLVRRVAQQSAAVEAHLVVQLEAAERFAGSPYARETLESLRLKPWWHVEIVGELPSTAFSPPPDVSIALLWMLRRERALLAAEEMHSYRAFIEQVFGQGQNLRRSLRRELTAEQLRRVAARLRIDLDARRGDLTFDQWLGVYRFAASSKGAALTRLRWAPRDRAPRRGAKRGKTTGRTNGAARRSRPPGPRSPRADR